MSELSDELLRAADALERLTPSKATPEVLDELKRLEDAVDAVGKAWSGSSLGYHANIYYKGLRPPPPGAHFSTEWGFQQLHSIKATTGEWAEWDPEGVKNHILERAGNPKLIAPKMLADRARKQFEQSKAEALSVLTTALADGDDTYLAAAKNEAEELEIPNAGELINRMLPQGQVISRDMVAIGQGTRVPPHVSVKADVLSYRLPLKACERLGEICRKAGSHLERVEKRRTRARRVGTNIFIGHGGSHAWRDLKDFIQDRLRLPWDEFNRVPVAGITNVARLSEMLDAAAFGFLVMTAEDEKADGTKQARMNVIHEAGLFQGRLGFNRAIVLLEEGCEEFSNIEGLGQIRFPKGNIGAKFEDVRRVLEREGLLPETTR